MPHEILKQLLQTEKQGNGTGAALCVYPLKIQDISILMSTKTPHFCQKMTEKNESKDAYPP